MRPQEIEKIAASVAGAFTAAGGLRAGCGAFSSQTRFDCSGTGYECSGNYECGGLAEFQCSDRFTCSTGFFCCCDYSPAAD